MRGDVAIASGQLGSYADHWRSRAVRFFFELDCPNEREGVTRLARKDCRVGSR